MNTTKKEKNNLHEDVESIELERKNRPCTDRLFGTSSLEGAM
jgi:hypothetical protein